MDPVKGPHASTSSACREYRGEEARPFPPMAASPSPRSSPDSEKLESEQPRDGSERESPVHPGENVFNFANGHGEEGGPVRLTNLTPISPTNDEVAELRSNPQPPIASPIFQMLSPRSMQGIGGYPFLFSAAGHHPPMFPDNEKYRKLALKKQKRDSRKEKNVKIAFKAEEVEGYLHNDNIDAVLQSLGEKGKEEKEQKKPKSKKPKEKSAKKEKKDSNRGSPEKEEISEEQEPVALPQGFKRGPTPTPEVKELLDFKDKFYLVPSPEPGPLARAKSREVFASNESLRSAEFTKVTGKKQRNKRSKEEPNPSKPPPPAAPPEVRRVSGYNLRSSVGNSSSVVGSSGGAPAPVSSSLPSRINSGDQNFQAPLPVLASEDFPELPGGLSNNYQGSSKPKLASAWAKLGSKSSDVVETEVVKSETEDKLNNSDKTAVKTNNCDVPSNSDISDHELTSENCPNIPVDYPESNDIEKDIYDSDDETYTQEEENDVEQETEECNDHDESEVEVKVESEKIKESVSRPVEEDIEVINSEEEFNSKRASNSAPVVILGDSDSQDWKSSEFTFGFDVNEDLVTTGFSSEVSPSGVVENQILSQVGTYYSGLGPGAPLTPIDSVDSAILTFGAPDPSLRPLIVGVPVGVPVPVTIANGALHYSIFPHYSIPYVGGAGVSAGQQAQFQDSEEPELSVGSVAEESKEAESEHQTISPESGISSASPLSWQPDASPNLAAPGSYPHPQAQADSMSPPLVNHVHQSLSSWQGHSVNSSPANSSRNSPTHGWEADKVREDQMENNGDEEETIEDDDSGLALSDKSVELRQCQEKFNLGEIVTYVSSSWSNIEKETPIYYSNSVNAS